MVFRCDTVQVVRDGKSDIFSAVIVVMKSWKRALKYKVVDAEAVANAERDNASEHIQRVMRIRLKKEV